MDLEVLIENTLNVLAAVPTIGCIHGLMCIGLGLIFGLAHRQLRPGRTADARHATPTCIWSPADVLAFLGPYVGPFVGTLCAGPIVFAGGALLHKFLIARVSGLRTAGSIDDGHFGQLLVTLGISLILQNGGLIVFGSTPETVRTPLASRAFEISGIYGDATVFLNKARLIACASAQSSPRSHSILVLEYTRLGKALRAAADNPTAATYMGIDVDRTIRIAFALGCGITAVAGGLMATYLSFGPFIGLDYVIIMYSRAWCSAAWAASSAHSGAASP